MPRQEKNATARTLYRLVDVQNLRSVIRERYVGEAFTMYDIAVGGREALLVLGAMVTEHAKWARDIEELTGQPAVVGNMTAAGALIIRRSDRGAWAVTFGMGFQLIDQALVDSSFGQRIAIRLGDPTKISSITRSAIDAGARVSRVTVPTGDGLSRFGFESFGEMVTRLVVRGRVPGLTHDGDVTVRGADALNIPLGRTAADLVADLDCIEALLATEPPEGMQVLEQLVPVRKPATRVSALDHLLAEALTAEDRDHQLALSWPFEHIGDNAPPTHFKLLSSGTGRGGASLREGLPDLDDLLAPLGRTSAPLDRLKQMRIQLFGSAEDDDPVSSAIPARKWLAFETPFDGKRYCLFDGQWFQMEDQYADQLVALTEEIFRKKFETVLPAWTAEFDEEDDYNKHLAAELGGICLDRKFVHTTAHKRGFEACDVLLRDGTLVHVKKTPKSAPASHLFAQALVSTESLAMHPQAVRQLRELVQEQGGDPTWVKDRPERVVIAMARKNPITAAGLFTFSRVTLVRAVHGIASRGIDVYVAPIALER
ncbi:DUF6119 family protein [Myceligenerans salitolerans]|uniref:TIGR04141 family sporadically distributed protein n=1 Tax=Myceligenerans salitolerans TaxID=1230528 RepID=A0ABS3I3S3_9MICO|nr:DUF6119 family protein [Myceligenerans salitolerans]MBO0607643.1 TIGR04141 family sporadically distributed protein [Myceligenerans salitolerans]